MLLIRVGIRHCMCGCGRVADDALVNSDGTVTPLAHSCAAQARRDAEAIPA